MGLKTPEEIAMDAALLADIGKKFDLTDVPAPAIPAEYTVTAGTASVPPVTVATEAPKKDKVDALIDRIAEMESKWAAERKEWEARLAERVAAEPEHQEPVAPQETQRDLWSEFLRDPAAVAEREGVPFDYLAASLVDAAIRKQGGRPDPALAARTGQYPVVREMDSRIGQLTGLVESMIKEREMDRYHANLDRLAAAPDRTKFPNVAKAVAKDASAVSEELREIVMVHAATTAKKNPKAPPLAPELAMAALEKRYALADRLLHSETPAPTGTQGVTTGNTSTKIPPATAANLSGSPAPIVVQTLEEMDRQLREEIVRKHPGN